MKVFQSGNCVIAKLYGYVIVPTYKVEDWPWDDDIYMHPFPVKATGVARLSDGDSFDFEKGKKIAIAKAENKIYSKASKYIEDEREFLEKYIGMMNRFIHKSEGVKNSK